MVLIGGDTGQQPGGEEWGGGGGHLRGDRVPRGGPTDSTEVSPPLMYWNSLISPRHWYFAYINIDSIINYRKWYQFKIVLMWNTRHWYLCKILLLFNVNYRFLDNARNLCLGKKQFPCEFWNLACVFWNVYCMELYKSSVLGMQNSRIVELSTVRVDLQLGILQCIKVVLNNRKYPYFTDTCIPHIPKNSIQKTFP